jgi:hypothetical protein
MNSREEAVQKVDLSSLEEGDIINVTTRSSLYCLEVLEASTGERAPRIGVTHERHFPGQIEFLIVGTAVKGSIQPTLKVGQRMVGCYRHKDDKDPKAHTLQTSTIQAITIDRA